MYRHFLASLAVLLVPFFVSAQQESSLSLAANPAFPEEGEAYSLTLKSSTFASRSTINWFIDGVESVDYRNSSTLEVPSGETPNQIRARLTLNNGTVLETTYLANPYRVDLVVSADTSVPPFYEGRRLPTSGSSITVKALVFRNGGESTDYSYLWKVNDKVQNGGALYGKDTVTFTPNFETNTSVTVEVFTRSGFLLTSESVEIPIVKPVLYFYEQNPLRGMSRTALTDPHIFVGDELRVRAEPYFMGNELVSSDTFLEWKINGQTVQSSPEDPNEVVLQKEGISGTANLSFHIRNMRQLLQGIEDSIVLRF